MFVALQGDVFVSVSLGGPVNDLPLAVLCCETGRRIIRIWILFRDYSLNSC